MVLANSKFEEESAAVKSTMFFSLYRTFGCMDSLVLGAFKERKSWIVSSLFIT